MQREGRRCREGRGEEGAGLQGGGGTGGIRTWERGVGVEGEVMEGVEHRTGLGGEMGGTRSWGRGGKDSEDV